ncbi:MAG: hypothetical protein P8X74_18130 [Reinekea sp.]
MNTLHQINRTTDIPLIAEVIEAANGEATKIRRQDGTIIPVEAHAAMTPTIKKGDRVVFTLSSANAIILDRLRRPGESPVKTFSEHDDHLLLESEKHILLKSPNATIALSADGNLSLNAENILTLAEALCIIRGKGIEIN